jgi:hypothetical protein
LEDLTHTRSCPALTPGEDDCTCGLNWRIRLRTEMELRNAWEKRAYEAEREINKPAAPEHSQGVESDYKTDLLNELSPNPEYQKDYLAAAQEDSPEAYEVAKRDVAEAQRTAAPEHSIEPPAAVTPTQMEPRECTKTMHMYVWSKAVCFLAAVQAENVNAARKLLLEEIDGSGDGSCPERMAAEKEIREFQPKIFHRANAEFALTESAELREVETENEKLRKQLVEATASLAKARESFSKECARYHAEGPKCVTCGRNDLDAIDVAVAKARLEEAEWWRPKVGLVTAPMFSACLDERMEKLRSALRLTAPGRETK